MLLLIKQDLSKYKTKITTNSCFSIQITDIFNFTCCQEVSARSEHQHITALGDTL
jgi:hypothetical protein